VFGGLIEPVPVIERGIGEVIAGEVIAAVMVGVTGAVKDPVMVTEKEADLVGVIGPDIEEVPVMVIEPEIERETLPVKDQETDALKDMETELLKELDTELEIELETEVETEVLTVGEIV